MLSKPIWHFGMAFLSTSTCVPPIECTRAAKIQTTFPCFSIFVLFLKTTCLHTNYNSLNCTARRKIYVFLLSFVFIIYLFRNLKSTKNVMKLNKNKMAENNLLKFSHHVVADDTDAEDEGKKKIK